MKKSALKKNLICSVLIIVFSCSCASLQQRALIKETISRAEMCVSTGEYKKALDVYAAAYAVCRSSELRQKYLEAGNHIKNHADHAFEEKIFAEAGSIYNILIESRIAEQDFAASLPFTNHYLERQMKKCSNRLLEIGLIKYREEKLEEAIAIWGKVLAFDRDNLPVIKAVDTANKQLQKLKNIDRLGRP